MGQAKKKQQRDCPALGRVITPTECGQGRNSEISCPLGCPHNPFALANYEAFLDLEGKVTTQLSKMLMGEATPTMRREMAGVIERNDLFGFQSHLVWHLYGEGRVAKWLQEGRFDDWKNDERVMIDCLMTTRVALIEFHEMRDEISWAAVDLLQPGEASFLAIDSGAAARAGRHDVIFGWVYDTPAGKKIAVSAVEVPIVADLMPVQVLERTLHHLGADEADRERWIQQNMMLLGESFIAINRALRDEVVGDATAREARALYSFDPHAYEGIIDVLESSPRICIVDEDFGMVAYILEEEGERRAPGVAAVEGIISFEVDGLSVSSRSAEDAPGCREFVEALDLPIVFEGESPPEGSASLRSYDKDLVPPEFLGRSEFERGHPRIRLADHALLPALPLCFERTFADEPHRLLDGATPREAAKEPGLRLRLIAMMKGYFRDCDRMRSRGEDIDVAPLALELGLEELVFPAPPLGEAEEFEEEVPAIRLTPPPPQPLLQGEELSRRVENVLHSDESLREHQVRLIFLLEELKRMESGFNFDELSLLSGVVTTMVGAMHPEPPEGFFLDTERMAEWYRQRISTGEPGEMMDEYLERIANETRQPEVVGAAYRLIHLRFETGNFKIRSKRLEQLNTAACAAIWEAAHWPVKL